MYMLSIRGILYEYKIVYDKNTCTYIIFIYVYIRILYLYVYKIVLIYATVV